MPWRKTDVSQERIKFVVLASRGEQSVAELCREFGISRQTGHSWLKRFEQGGVSEIYERSRRPRSSPGQIGKDRVDAVLALRRQWPDWGALKLQHKLKQHYPEWAPLSVSAVHRILLRNHMVQDQDRHRPALERFERSAPNELWQMDFKGPAGFNQTVGPLSILDDHSRYLLALKHLGSTQASGVKETLEETFQAHGLPETMLVDHGTPWWNGASKWGWTELTVWIMRQGIRLAFSGFRHPQTQGKVERMHGALQRAIRKRPAEPQQQSWLDEFRMEYNLVRPHQALQMQTPHSRWQPSPRPFQAHPPEFLYDSAMEVKRLSGEGQLHWRGRRWEISRALRGQRVGLCTLDSRVLVFYCNTALRQISLTGTGSIALPAEAPSLER
jgi:transposase InsO family protein